jgi:hypothetical protein
MDRRSTPCVAWRTALPVPGRFRCDRKRRRGCRHVGTRPGDPRPDGCRVRCLGRQRGSACGTVQWDRLARNPHRDRRRRQGSTPAFRHQLANRHGKSREPIAVVVGVRPKPTLHLHAPRIAGHGRRTLSGDPCCVRQGSGSSGVKSQPMLSR